MVYVHGDSHGEFGKFIENVNQLMPNDVLIHVGDFGFYEHSIAELIREFPNGLPCLVLVVDGNHEDFNYLYRFPVENGLRKIFENLYHVPRGTVLDIDGKLFGFLGGGESIDYTSRVKNVSWWEEERITNGDISRLVENCKDDQLDYLITHVCPQEFRDVYFPTLMLQNWGLPDDWYDVSMQQVSRVVDILQPKTHIFGHMHKSIITSKEILLDTDEIKPLYF
jgi:calcineurin-like phosphoesterase family protein